VWSIFYLAVKKLNNLYFQLLVVSQFIGKYMFWRSAFAAFVFLQTPLSALDFSSAFEIDMCQERQSELSVIDHVFRVMYAPLLWKKEQYGWDPLQQSANVSAAITSDSRLSTVEFRKLLRRYALSAKDYHVSIFFTATERSRLPFRVKTAEGKVFISYVDRKDSFVNALQEGDELLSMDDQPAFSLLEGIIQNEMPGGNYGTDLALAAIRFTSRSAVVANDVPQGSAKIAVRHQSSGRVAAYRIPWKYEKEKISPKEFSKGIQAPPSKRELLYQMLAKRKSLLPTYREFSEEQFGNTDDDAPVGLGTKKSFIPPLGDILWDYNGKYIYGYLYKTADDKRIAYVRIPDYMTGVLVGDEGATASDEFALLMRFFENTSQGLVLDQVHNPGGMDLQMLWLASMLSDKPLDMFKEHIILTPSVVQWALELQELIEEEKEFLLEKERKIFAHIADYCTFITEQWSQGKILSDSIEYMGLPTIAPDSTAHYSKPILMLVDGLSLSCGDILPALLQDNGRAVIFGETTAGAGGNVESLSFPNHTGIDEVTYTTSMVIRKNGQPVENLGITPDIPYAITAKDLQTNYQGYVKKVNEAISSLVK
jgi:hypothetical protein